VSAAIDLEDAQENSRRRAALRRAGVNPDFGDDLDVPGPSNLAYEVAARMAPADEPFDAHRVAAGVRGKWLRRTYREARG
jgi:hypothetical protein